MINRIEIPFADERPKLTTNQKALKINLDPLRYGTFAEIGAGQEVARWFFKVGAAAGTISKSMSAYDMAVSDAIYGRCKRYVSRERLQSMLDHEHRLNIERLQSSRGGSTAFFAFADTVAARNYQGTNECHGWMGVKFQAHPRDEDSQIIIHVRMLDHENGLQQEALGIVGVNLLYAAFFLHHKPHLMLESLLDNLTTDRIEIDMVDFSGIEFRHVDKPRDEPQAGSTRPERSRDLRTHGRRIAAVGVVAETPHPGRERQLSPCDKSKHGHAPLRVRAFLGGAGGQRKAGRPANGDHHAKSARDRSD